jgi:hypothetical protein
MLTFKHFNWVLSSDIGRPVELRCITSSSSQCILVLMKILIYLDVPHVPNSTSHHFQLLVITFVFKPTSGYGRILCFVLILY